MSTLTFWYEFASTYSYPAAMRIEAEAEKRGVRVTWRPILLGPIFGAQGLTDSPFNMFPTKGNYMWRDLKRVCDKLGLPLERPHVFPQNGLLGARVATALAGAERVAFSRALYNLEFAERRTISEPAVVSEALTRAGLDPSLIARAEEPAVKAALRAAVEEAQALHLFGAPSFTAEDGELFWGNDRLEDALDWAVGKK